MAEVVVAAFLIYKELGKQKIYQIFKE